VKVWVSSRAKRELLEIIIDSADRYGVTQARATDSRLRNAIRRLEAFPHLGRVDPYY